MLRVQPSYNNDPAHLCPDAQLLRFCCLLCRNQLLVVWALLAAAGPDLHHPGHAFNMRLLGCSCAVHASKRSCVRLDSVVAEW
jgi:hypothetical protein